MQNLFGEDIPFKNEILNAVEEVLRDNPKARDDDMVLYAEVWKKQGITFDFDKFITYGHKPEKIGRIRRDLQAKGFYESVNKAGRKVQQDKYHSYFSSKEEESRT